MFGPPAAGGYEIQAQDDAEAREGLDCGSAGESDDRREKGGDGCATMKPVRRRRLDRLAARTP